MRRIVIIVITVTLDYGDTALNQLNALSL